VADEPITVAAVLVALNAVLLVATWRDRLLLGRDLLPVALLAWLSSGAVVFARGMIVGDSLNSTAWWLSGAIVLVLTASGLRPALLMTDLIGDRLSPALRRRARVGQMLFIAGVVAAAAIATYA
jgi:hypothetical protein